MTAADVIAMPASTTFKIGEGLVCDLSRLVDTKLLVQANSGAGKSWCIRRILEQTHGHVQQLVIDPEGEFASLRERFDYVLAAKNGGDTAVEPRAAALLAERLLELGVSAVLDIYELKPDERKRFVKLFLEALVDAPKKLWHPALVIIDEAHVYCPEAGDAESADAVKGLCSRGRKRGFSAVLATQRLSKLSKDAAAECNNKLFGRTSLDVDMKRAADELGFTAGDKLQLRDLENGEFFAFGPALSRTVTRVHVGSVKTTHPKAGSYLSAVVPPPTAKVRALLPQLADLPAEVESRARTVADLTKQLAEKDKQIRQLSAGTAMPASATAQIDRFQSDLNEERDVTTALRNDVATLQKLASEQPRFRKADLDQLERIATALAQLGEKVAVVAGELRKTVDAASQPVLLSAPALPVVAQRVAPIKAVPTVISKPRQVSIQAPGENRLSRPEQRILNAIAWLESIGVDMPEQPAVSFLAGYSFGSGAFNNPRGSLKQKGYVEYLSGGLIRLTDSGRELAEVPEQALTTEALHARVLSRLPGPEQRVLRPLLDAYPDALSQETLASKAEYALGSGAFNNPRGRLRKLGLVEYQSGMVRARDILFPA